MSADPLKAAIAQVSGALAAVLVVAVFLRFAWRGSKRFAEFIVGTARRICEAKNPKEGG